MNKNKRGGGEKPQKPPEPDKATENVDRDNDGPLPFEETVRKILKVPWPPPKKNNGG